MILGAGINVVVTNPTPPVVTVTAPTDQVHVVVPVAGPRGPAGAAGGDRFTYQQTVPAATWTIPHNLGAYPFVNLFLDEDPTAPVWTDITYPDNNTAVVEWPTPVTGRAEI